jgi:MFS family permease
LLVPLRVALRHSDFWRLWTTFAICGATTNGLIGTHLIPHAIDQGLSAVAEATTLAMMGVLDIVGTLGSGWLSDRYDKRILLASYYGLRGLSLLFLPYADDLTKLALFGVVYGLDWIATVPPTAGLASDIFGTRSGPILFGWVFFGHQVGAARSTTSLIPILGPRTREQLDATLGALDVTLTPEQIARLDAASEIPLGVPHTMIKENAARVAGGKLDRVDVPAIPVA